MKTVDLHHPTGSSRSLTIRRVFGTVEGMPGSYEMILNWADPGTDHSVAASGIEILATFPHDYAAKVTLMEFVKQYKKEGYVEAL